MFRHDLTKALRFAWLVIAGLLAPVLLAPVVLSPAAIATLTPVCEWKTRYHRECPACGLTTGFILTARGKFSEAERRNQASVPLYTLFLLNECAAVFVLWKRRPVEEFSCRS